MKRQIKIFFIISIFYIVLITTFNFKIEYKNTNFKLKYTGFIWVCLDYYSIKKYNSDDKLMNWFVLYKNEKIIGSF